MHKNSFNMGGDMLDASKVWATCKTVAKYVLFLWLGLLFWRGVLYVFNPSETVFTLTGQLSEPTVSYILSELAASVFVGAFGAVIFKKFQRLNNRYHPQIISGEIRPQDAGGVGKQLGVELFIYFLPGIIFLILNCTDKSIFIARKELSSSILIGFWVCIGFNTVALETIFSKIFSKSAIEIKP